ncbi:MAG TPA: hypothetical protein VNE39_26355 [Planctomycetota bacterium]|nr:hypothetical protein [Planctomycetota bacterium]
MPESLLRYLAGVALCAVVAVAYAATRQRGARAVARDSVFIFACMLGVVAAVAAVVFGLCALK